MKKTSLISYKTWSACYYNKLSHFIILFSLRYIYLLNDGNFIALLTQKISCKIIQMNINTEEVNYQSHMFDKQLNFVPESVFLQAKSYTPVAWVAETVYEFRIAVRASNPTVKSTTTPAVPANTE